MESHCLLGLTVERKPAFVALVGPGVWLYIILCFLLASFMFAIAVLLSEALITLFDFSFKRTSRSESRTLNNIIRFEHISFGLGNREKCTFVFFQGF